jgi:hypothetical protein
MAKSEGAAAPRQTGVVNFSWPHDPDGHPMVLVTFQASELIGLPNYSNVTVGPASVTRFVEEHEVEEGLKKCAEQTEGIIAAERDNVLASVQSQVARK